MARRPDKRSGGRSYPVAGLVSVLVGLVAALAGCSAHHIADAHPDAPPDTTRSPVPSPGAPSTRPARPVEMRALRALERWDRQRSAAYAAGSTSRLRRLYVPGSTAGEADVALLQQYLHRGLHVRGMRTQVLAVSVLDHREDRWRMRVVDRLVGAVATGADRPARLPQGRAGGYVLTLRREDGQWRMASTRRTRSLLS